MARIAVPMVAKTSSVRYRTFSWSYVVALKPAQSNGFVGALSRRETKEVSPDATECLERQARTPVRTHQGGTSRARLGGGQGGRDRGAHSQQGTGAPGRGSGNQPDLDRGHLVRPPRRIAIPPRVRRSDL